MAIPLRTDWSKIRYDMLFIFSISVLLASTVATGLSTSGKQKRQLFRENLIPQIGGKVPESAYYKDRLALNRLNQNGIYTQDGVYLEQRPILYDNKGHFQDTIKITVPPNNYLVAPEGRYYTPRTVDTSYIIRKPVTYNIIPTVPFHSQPLSPVTSLRLIHYSNQNKLNAYQNPSWNEIVLPTQILSQLAPYLYKFLHKDD